VRALVLALLAIGATIALGMGLRNSGDNLALAPSTQVPPCPVPKLDVSQWTKVGVRHARVWFRLPADARQGFIETPHHQTWMMPRSYLTVAIGPDSTSVPLRVYGAGLFSKHDRRECLETVAGRTMRLETYRREGGGGGPYVVAAWWPLLPGSWLRIGSASEQEEGQRKMLAALRTMTFDSTKSATRANTRCSTSDVRTVEWTEMRIPEIGVSFRTPPGTIVRDSGRFDPSWVVGDEELLQALVIKTPDWNLEPPHDSGAIWCQNSIAGRRAEILVVNDHRGEPDTYTARAYIEISPGTVLHFWQLSDRPEMAAQFLAMVRTVRSSGRT
jgi:hypothetical protein